MNCCQIDRFDGTTFLAQCRKENKFTYPSFDLSTLLAVDDYGILTLSQLQIDAKRVGYLKIGNIDALARIKKENGKIEKLIFREKTWK